MRNIEKKDVFLFIGMLLIAIALIYFVSYYLELSEDNLKNNIASKFTCTCCEGSILETPNSCFMAGGMREYIDMLVENNKGDEEKVMVEAVKKFGILSLIDRELKKEYGLLFLENVLKDTPNISIEPNEVDLGVISNSRGVVIQDFIIKNEGKEDLIITDLKTSCACLTASFVKDGKESVRVGRFSHSEGWTFVLKPSEEALLRAYYDPRVTNWQLGHVERIITITSNDPIYFEKIIKIMVELVP